MKKQSDSHGTINPADEKKSRQPLQDGISERKGPKQKRPVQKEPEQKEAEQKRPEQKEPEQKRPAQKEPEQKEAEQKRPAQKEPEQKGPEQKRPMQKEPVQKKTRTGRGEAERAGIKKPVRERTGKPRHGKTGNIRNTDSVKRGRRHKRKKPGGYAKLLRIFRGWMICAGIFLIAALWAVFVMRAAGRQQLEQDRVGSVAEMRMNKDKPRDPGGAEKGAEGTAEEAAAAAEEEPAEEKEGRVRYKGKIYDYNQDIMTFLVMGIDQRSETVREQTEGFEGGSADTIFLVVLNPHTNRMQLVAIDRNTMADVDIYDYYGEYKETVQTQICVQHGFGDGTVKSAQYMEKAVSNLLYGLPLNGYCAINMGAIEKINDAVGGVDVVVLEDMTKWDKRLVKGETVHLEGRTALRYVRSRDTDAFGSAEKRLERQRQYVSAFIAKAKSRFREEPSLPVAVFQELRPYMTTDLNVEKAAYLAGVVAGFEFGDTDMYKIPGKTVMGDVYEEFYVDETAMYEMLLEIFYEEAEE